MSLVKNISGGGLDVIAPGFEQWVEDGETVEVPDVQPDGVSPLVWNPRQWEPVADPVEKPIADPVEKPKRAGKAAV